MNSPHSLHVLVVDDELLIRWSLAEALSERGHVVTEAGDAASACRIVGDSAHRPDVVLLDYRLPDSDDLGLLATIRRAAPDAPVILMTAFATPDILEQALAAGALVITKPFDMDNLAALIDRTVAAWPS